MPRCLRSTLSPSVSQPAWPCSTGVLACFSVGEISLLSTFIACVGTVVGMVFSYLTRG